MVTAPRMTRDEFGNLCGVLRWQRIDMAIRLERVIWINGAIE